MLSTEPKHAGATQASSMSGGLLTNPAGLRTKAVGEPHRRDVCAALRPWADEERVFEPDCNTRERHVDINWLDLGFAVVMLLFIVRGLLNGLLREVAGLVGVLLGFFLAGRWYTLVAPHISRFIPNPDLTGLAAYGIIFVGVLLVVVLLASLLRRAMQLTFTAWPRTCGAP